MAAPQPGYPTYEQQEQYETNQQPDYEDNPSTTQQPASSATGRRKRHYAGQAYDFGAGANSALGGQQSGVPNPGPYPLPPGASNGPYGHGALPASPPAVGAAPGYGQPPPGVGGYQSPEPGYPSQGPTPIQPGVGAITQGMGNMGIGGQGQHPSQQLQRPQLNQLYPTDLLNQPFHVSELDLPQPPIILPPNVRMNQKQMDDLLRSDSQVSRHRPTPTVHQNTCAQH